MNEWWLIALKKMLWLIAMALLMGWLSRSRFWPRPKEESGSLRHPPNSLIMGLVLCCFFAGLTIFSVLSADKSATWGVAVFGSAAAMSAPLVLDYFMARHRVSDEGLAYRKLLGSTGFLKWTDLERIRYRSIMKWFHLKTTDGRVVRISVMLMGLPEFAQALLKSAPAEAMDSDTLHILQATAEGNPPSLWE